MLALILATKFSIIVRRSRMFLHMLQHRGKPNNTHAPTSTNAWHTDPVMLNLGLTTVDLLEPGGEWRPGNMNVTVHILRKDHTGDERNVGATDTWNPSLLHVCLHSRCETRTLLQNQKGVSLSSHSHYRESKASPSHVWCRMNISITSLYFIRVYEHVCYNHTCFSETVIGSFRTIQVTLSCRGGVVSDPG